MGAGYGGGREFLLMKTPAGILVQQSPQHGRMYLVSLNARKSEVIIREKCGTGQEQLCDLRRERGRSHLAVFQWLNRQGEATGRWWCGGTGGVTGGSGGMGGGRFDRTLPEKMLPESAGKIIIAIRIAIGFVIRKKQTLLEIL